MIVHVLKHIFNNNKKRRIQQLLPQCGQVLGRLHFHFIPTLSGNGCLPTVRLRERC